MQKGKFRSPQAHRKHGKSARASPTPHHTLNEEPSARFTAQHLSALGIIVSFSTSKWPMEEVHVIAAPNTKTVSHCKGCVKFRIFGCVRLILFRNKNAQKIFSKSLVPVFWLFKHYIHRNILFQADF